MDTPVIYESVIDFTAGGSPAGGRRGRGRWCRHLATEAAAPYAFRGRVGQLVTV